MRNWIIPIVLVTAITLLGAAFVGHLADFNTHDHPEYIHQGQKVCIEGGGYFPNMIPSPQPFLVCGVIDGFNPKTDDLAPRTRDDVRFLY